MREPTIRGVGDAARWIGATGCLGLIIEGTEMMIRAMSLTRSFVTGLGLVAFGIVLGWILVGNSPRS